MNNLLTKQVQIDVNGYYYVDEALKYYKHQYIVEGSSIGNKGEKTKWSNWTNLNAYEFSKKNNVRITKTSLKSEGQARKVNPKYEDIKDT